MINLKRTKKDIKKSTAGVPESSEYTEEYPWGTRLSFQKPELDKIKNLKSAKIGDMVNISCIGQVVEVSMREMVKGDDDHRVEIQIQKISMDTESEEMKGFNEKEDDD
uniref:Putative capsid protein n=1 Tax=viral metagenome TaxID=1070528 RepID=A0A6H1ZZ41_9ZZZZ